MSESTSNQVLRAVPVWDRATRCFHWLNALLALGLGATGTLMTFDAQLGLADRASSSLATSHTWLGYLFAANLLWRLVWIAVDSTKTARSGLAPVRPLRRSAPALGTLVSFVAIGIMYLVLFVQASTGAFVALSIVLDLPSRAVYAAVAEAHYFNYFVVLALVLMHLVAVTIKELTNGAGTISAMVNGKKFVSVARAED